MNADVRELRSQDLFAARADHPVPAALEQQLESAWFDAPPPRRSSPSSQPPRAPRSIPPPPIDDPVADDWFR